MDEEAVKTYRQAMEANPDNLAILERLGDLLIRMGRFPDAQKEVETLATHVANDPRVWLRLGAIYYEQKAFDKAIEAFRRVVTLEPTNLRAHFYLSSALFDGGKETEALAELEAILRADPRSIDARLQLAFIHSKAKRHEQAIRVLQEALEPGPRSAPISLFTSGRPTIARPSMTRR